MGVEGLFHLVLHVHVLRRDIILPDVLLFSLLGSLMSQIVCFAHFYSCSAGIDIDVVVFRALVYRLGRGD